MKTPRPADEIEAIDLIRKGLDAYGGGFSIHTGFTPAGREAIVEKGKTVGVRLVPRRHRVTIGFYRNDGLEVSLVVEEGTMDRCVETALETVLALLKPDKEPG